MKRCRKRNEEEPEKIDKEWGGDDD